VTTWRRDEPSNPPVPACECKANFHFGGAQEARGQFKRRQHMTMKFIAAASAFALWATAASATSILSTGGAASIAGPDPLARLQNQTLPPTLVQEGSQQSAGTPISVPTVGNVPEPASWALLIAGFATIGLMARRRGAATA
jgi:hypothetical protein